MANIFGMHMEGVFYTSSNLLVVKKRKCLDICKEN